MQILKGKIVKIIDERTCKIRREYILKMRKTGTRKTYSRNMLIHIPKGVQINLEDVVKVKQCPRISKRKAFILIS
jgi:ribosomal protein S17